MLKNRFDTIFSQEVKDSILGWKRLGVPHKTIKVRLCKKDEGIWYTLYVDLRKALPHKRYGVQKMAQDHPVSGWAYRKHHITFTLTATANSLARYIRDLRAEVDRMIVASFNAGAGFSSVGEATANLNGDVFPTLVDLFPEADPYINHEDIPHSSD